MPSPSDIRAPFPTSGNIPRVGKLRAGVKKTSSKAGGTVSFPSAVDYFVVNADASTSQQSADSFHAVYGDEPRALRVVLPAHHPREVFTGAWRLYGSGGLLKRNCEGPGRQCRERVGGDWVVGPCACDRDGLAADDRNRCAERWTLNVLLMDVVGVGVWQFDTGSQIAVRDIAKMLNLIYDMRGSLLRTECMLRLVPRQVAPGGVAKTVFIAQLDVADMTPADALAMAAQTGEPVPQLPPSSLDEAPDELLDHGSVHVVEAPVPPSAPPPPAEPVVPAGPSSRAVIKPVAIQLRDMSLDDRKAIYELAGIPRGTRAADVRALLCAAWDTAGLPDFAPAAEPNLYTLLGKLRALKSDHGATGVEAFQHFADTGQETDPGDQLEMGVSP